MDTQRIESFLEKLVLKSGNHSYIESGACVMEAVAFVAGEPHSDHPACASKVIGAFMRSWNDSLNTEDRQMLKPYVTKLVGTAASEEVEFKRAYLAQDWYIRVFTPTWLELAGLSDHAETLRKLNEICDLETTKKAQPSLSAASSAAYSAARSAAYSAAYSAADAAYSAAYSAARSAAYSAAYSAADAAYSAASSAAYSAASSAAYSAASSAARSAARSAASSAARSAAYSAADAAYSAAYSAARSAAYSAARSAAEEALSPTVKRLQKSAIDLLDRMIAVS